MNIETQEKNEIRTTFENYRDERNACLESEGHKPGSKWHVTQAHYATWEAARQSLVIELPQRLSFEMQGITVDPKGDLIEYCDTVAAIQSTGVKVK